MARVTVEDCLQHVDNRFELIMVAAKRARQIANYGAEPRVPLDKDKPTVLALRELAGDKISVDEIMTPVPPQQDDASPLMAE